MRCGTQAAARTCLACCVQLRASARFDLASAGIDWAAIPFDVTTGSVMTEPGVRHMEEDAQAQKGRKRVRFSTEADVHVFTAEAPEYGGAEASVRSGEHAHRGHAAPALD